MVIGSVACYAIFLVLTRLGPPGQRFWLVVAWPYAFLLAIQKIVGNPSSLAAFIAAWLGGLGLVVGFTAALQKAPLFRLHPRLALGTSLLAWYVPLGAITLFATGAAHILGWPYGE